MMTANKFGKMYLISPDTFEHLKIEQQHRNELDNEMFKIIKMNKINDAKKWYLYRQQLMNFANKRRRQQNVPKLVLSNNVNTNQSKNILKDVETQTKRVFNKESMTQTDPTFDISEEDIIDNSDQFVSPRNYLTPDQRLEHSSSNNYEDYEGMDFNVDDLTSPTNRKKNSRVRQLQFDDSDVDKSFRPRAVSSAAAMGSKLKSRYDAKRPVLKKDGSSQSRLNFPVRKPVTRSQSTLVQQGNNSFKFKWSRFN